MDRDTRRKILAARGLSPDLLAVDPVGCGCTECMVGECIPEDRIPREQLDLYRRLVREGILDDHTYGERFGLEGFTLSEASIKAQLLALANELDDRSFTINDGPTGRIAERLTELANELEG